MPRWSRAQSLPRAPSSLRIEDVQPAVDCGAAPVKRCVGDDVHVEATVISHGHKVIRTMLCVRPPGSVHWERIPMRAAASRAPDRYEACFRASHPGCWEFAIEAWSDPFAAWQEEVRRKRAAGQQDLRSELTEGALIAGRPLPDVEAALALELETEEDATGPTHPLTVTVDPALARFGAWYELFPRSFGGFEGVRAVLPELARLGFDVVYLPPIHPIGTTNRKGRNNRVTAEPGDVGSPWAIGSAEGGHTAVHPDLGTVDQFRALVADAREHGIEIALDIALQASPDHPWLTSHPEWFRRRPDGTVKFAENPPKRYEDIVNFDFESEAWRALWAAVIDIFRYWIDQGVRVFRVDNPHTKPLPFWAKALDELRREHPDVILLAEAFTAPPMMYALAKLGFHQSYTYFTWRNTKDELASYMTELAGPVREYFRPNFFVNTPDILSEYLQRGGPPAFRARLVLAATLSPSYGLYSGFEHCERAPRELGSEEYLDSDKYEVKDRALDGPLLPLAGRLNQIRRERCVFRRIDNIRLLESAHDSLFAFAKGTGADAVVVVVNLDPKRHAEGLAVVPPELGLPGTFTARDLLTDERYAWQTGRNYVLLPPGGAHVMAFR
jgi:starch synthase (maltosyl-transferring)